MRTARSTSPCHHHQRSSLTSRLVTFVDAECIPISCVYWILFSQVQTTKQTRFGNTPDREAFLEQPSQHGTAQAFYFCMICTVLCHIRLAHSCQTSRASHCHRGFLLYLMVCHPCPRSEQQLDHGRPVIALLVQQWTLCKGPLGDRSSAHLPANLKHPWLTRVCV